MFSVSGYIKGVAYEVSVTPGAAEGDPMVTGSPNALALLERHGGEVVSVTPTGPSYTVASASRNPEVILGSLMALTDVRDISGDDIPEVIPPTVLGAVY